MTVHAIRVETSKISSGTPIPTVVQNLLSGTTRVLPEQETEFRLYEPTETEALDEPYRAGLWRFDPDDHPNPDALLDALENALQGTAKWYRLRYHLCDHDLSGDERTGGCEWDDSKTRTGGPVPSELA